MLPQAYRSRTQKDRLATFFTTNALPQDPFGNNRQGTAWANFENFVRGIVFEGNRQIHVFSGGSGSGNYAFPGNPLNLTPAINIPEETWKVAMILEPGQELADITTNTPVIAISTPNRRVTQLPDTPDVNDWSTWIVTVNDLESITGLDLLSNLPDEVENIIEQQFYSGPTTVSDFLNI